MGRDRVLVQAQLDITDTLFSLNTLDARITFLQDLQREYGPCEVKHQYYGHEGAFEIVLVYTRPETAEELEQRLKKEKQRQRRAAKKAEKELKTLRALKEKYPNVE